MIDISPSADALLKRLLDQAREDAVLLLDPEGTIVACLPGAASILGYSTNELVGQNIDVLFVPEDLQRGIPDLESCIAEAGGRSENERWHIRKDGSLFWGSGRFTALRDDSGALIGFGKIFRDGTDLRFQLDRLENKVEGLQKSNDRYKVGFASIGHEFRNPLQALGTSLKILRSLPSDVHAAEVFQMIEGQLALMSGLTNDLFELARVDGGKTAIQLEPLGLNEIVATSVETCKSVIEEKLHEVQLLLQPTPLMVNGEASKLMQVCVNVLINAARYTPTRGHIWVKTTTEGSEAVLRVEDDGAGIPADMLRSVFDLFTQVESVENKARGLGVGLTLVRNYVDLHGDSVQATSDGKNKGSQFTVRIPLLQSS